MGAKKIAVVAPYMKPLTELVVDYIGSEGYEVVDYRALEIADNLEVGRHDAGRLPEIVAGAGLPGGRDRAVGVRADAVAGGDCEGGGADGQAGGDGGGGH